MSSCLHEAKEVRVTRNSNLEITSEEFRCIECHSFMGIKTHPAAIDPPWTSRSVGFWETVPNSVLP